ncbi:putative disease resistance RPP13-like protein 1 [Cocos nucifera]|uniref:Putative disease resistance RPP13-like protein 1 n=1 Tax=Cocos nucifera TaxID=13894 RepID=A0A8K0N151_COCNU|nr:putative disease resistance RPP13-like protein 1 [Cocos nucifera]
MNEKGCSRYSRIAELEHLNLLSGDLQIECPIKAKNLVADAQKAKLKEKKNLRSLTLSWKGYHSEVDTLLESLLPPQNLQVLNIDGYMGTKFSSWMMNKIESWLPNLVHLTLSNVHICDCLPPLGQLPALQSLELRYMSGLRYMDTESYVICGDRFIPYPSLKELHFENIPDLEEWPTAVIVDNGGGRREVFIFTSLKTLTAFGCPKLKPKPCLPASSSSYIHFQFLC